MSRRLALAAMALTVTLAAACSASPDRTVDGGPQRVQVVTPLPADAEIGVGYRLYAPRDDLLVNGRPAVETFGVTTVVALPDGTIFALQDARVSIADSDDHSKGRDRGLALVMITPEGVGTLVDSPYADRERGLDVWPLCASTDGELYAIDDRGYRLVARNPSGEWRGVTAPNPVGGPLMGTGDGGPAEQATVGLLGGCAAAADGSVYIADGCVLRRVDPEGTIDTVAGRPELGDRGSGCGSVDQENRSDPPTVPLPSYDGPAREAELGALSALATAPDGSVWMSALRGVQQFTPDGRLRSVPIPDELDFPGTIRSLATLPDGTLLAAYGSFGPTGIAALDPAAGVWTILVPPDEEFTGVAAPAPLEDLSLYGAGIAASADRLYIAVNASANAGIVVVPWG